MKKNYNFYGFFIIIDRSGTIKKITTIILQVYSMELLPYYIIGCYKIITL